MTEEELKKEFESLVSSLIDGEDYIAGTPTLLRAWDDGHALHHYPESEYELDPDKVLEWVLAKLEEAKKEGKASACLHALDLVCSNCSYIDENGDYQRVDRLEEAKREAREEVYRERDLLVFALTNVFPSWRSLHEESDKSWERDWMNIVFIQLPTGQASWHIHDSELSLFVHLELKENCWDGHNNERKYERIKKLKAFRAKSLPFLSSNP